MQTHRAGYPSESCTKLNEETDAGFDPTSLTGPVSPEVKAIPSAAMAAFADRVEEARQGSNAARAMLADELYEMLLPIARRWGKSPSVDADDMLQVGVNHVLKMLQAYDRSKSSFVTWASVVARRKMSDEYYRNHSQSKGMAERAKRLRTIGFLITEKTGRKATLRELAEAADLTAIQVEECLNQSTILSLDELTDAQLESSFVEDAESSTSRDTSKLMSCLAKMENSDHRSAVVLYYINGMSQHEVAKILNIEYATCRMWCKRGRDYLRKAMNDLD